MPEQITRYPDTTKEVLEGALLSAAFVAGPALGRVWMRPG